MKISCFSSSSSVSPLLLLLIFSFFLTKPLGAQTPLRISTSPHDEIGAAWNPQNETVAYLRSQFGFGFPFDIYQAQASGGLEGPLFVGPAIDFGPAFSPAWIGTSGFLACYEGISVGEYLFVSTSSGPTQRMLADGSDSTAISAIFADAGNSGGYIRLSRDGGTMIVREIDFLGNANLRSASIFDVLFSPLLPLQPLPLSSFGVVQLQAIPGSGNFFEQGVAISPDGSSFVVALPLLGSNTPHDLWLFRTDGSQPGVNLTNTAALGVWNVTPDFSPDGTAVVFARWSGVQGESYELFGLDPDLTITQLTNTPFFNELAPSWAPDGLRIAYQGAHFSGFESFSPALFPGESANWNIYTLQVRTIRIVTPVVVPNIPVITTSGRDITISAERFDGGSLSKVRSLNAMLTPGLGPAKTGKKRLAIEYNYTVERTQNENGDPVRNDKRRKVSKKSSTTIRKLPPGQYRASYRVKIIKKNPDGTTRTKFSRPSPMSNFRVR